MVGSLRLSFFIFLYGNTIRDKSKSQVLMRRVACELYHIHKRYKSDIGSGAHVVYLTVAYVRYVRFVYPKMSVVDVRLISIKKVEKGSQTRKEFK